MWKALAGACVLIFGAGFLACAGPQASGPKSVATVPADALPAAEAIPSFLLVKDEPPIASATRTLDASGNEARSPALLVRAKAAIAVGQQIRAEHGTLISLPALAPGHERYLACYDLAYRDLKEIVVRYPAAAEAPEAQYLLGLIHDYPHLDLFEDAVSQYRETMASYPGTHWALKAAERIELIEGIRRGPTDSPHNR